ncbi:hypothetical protein PHISP_05707 [Aspergillus sp. HF37]|nr:hypothetical protein PHISP_05707 [Aspergillus sp. HF37]
MNSVDLGRCKRFVQYLLDPEPKNDEEPDASIWCLGREYDPNDSTVISRDQPKPPTSNESEPSGETAESSSAHGWPESFLTDFESRIWITYRSNFPPIPRHDGRDGVPSMTLSVRLRSQFMDSQGFTSDTGWGCMIRSGQSLLANALSILVLGRDWRRGTRVDEEARILSLFAESPNAPFSIHRFVKHGAEYCDKYPGQWFGPSAAARCIQALSAQCDDPKLRVYVTNDTSDVYEDRFMEVACDGSGRVQPILILLGIRLGIDHVTPVYWEGLKAALQYPQSVGIAGGRPSASHYFVGVQGSHYFYLDPHHTRPALPDHQIDRPYGREELDTYHTRRLRRIHAKDMDPSMLIGFLIKDEHDWRDWKRRVASVPGKPIAYVHDRAEPEHGQGRSEALDEVEALDDFEISG